MRLHTLNKTNKIMGNRNNLPRSWRSTMMTEQTIKVNDRLRKNEYKYMLLLVNFVIQTINLVAFSGIIADRTGRKSSVNVGDDPQAGRGSGTASQTLCQKYPQK